MVREELLDVNARLRALAPARRVGARQTREQGADRQRYRDWLQEEQSLDEEIICRRQALLRGTAQAPAVLTDRQREIWDLHSQGLSTRAIGRRLGIHHATAARTLARARKALAEEAERFAGAESLALPRLDMGDASTAKQVLAAVTARQAAYLYLYYAEWLSLREISALTGTHHSAVLRTIRRGLRSIGGAAALRAADRAGPKAGGAVVQSAGRWRQKHINTFGKGREKDADNHRAEGLGGREPWRPKLERAGRPAG